MNGRNLTTSPKLEKFKKDLKDKSTEELRQLWEEYRDKCVNETGQVMFWLTEHLYYFAIENELASR